MFSVFLLFNLEFLAPETLLLAVIPLALKNCVLEVGEALGDLFQSLGIEP